MPKTAEERRCRRAEEPLPQGKSRHHRQIPAQPQLRAADAEEGEKNIELVERFAFYDRAKKAYAVVATGETAIYANIILKKGVVIQ